MRVSSIGEYIKEQREQAKISLRQLASPAGVSNPYLSQIERGRAPAERGDPAADRQGPADLRGGAVRAGRDPGGPAARLGGPRRGAGRRRSSPSGRSRCCWRSTTRSAAKPRRRRRKTPRTPPSRRRRPRSRTAAAEATAARLTGRGRPRRGRRPDAPGGRRPGAADAGLDEEDDDPLAAAEPLGTARGGRAASDSAGLPDGRTRKDEIDHEPRHH